jgi:hypothetical protein
LVLMPSTPQFIRPTVPRPVNIDDFAHFIRPNVGPRPSQDPSHPSQNARSCILRDDSTHAFSADSEDARATAGGLVARWKYADFPMLSGDFRVQMGDLKWFDSQHYDTTYDLIGDLELDGCLLQGAGILYHAGSVLPRTVTIRNCVFERADIDFETPDPMNWGGRVEEQLVVANNLFYFDNTVAWPISGANWTFIDNIFDHATNWSNPYGNNFPGTMNNNAYVDMSYYLSGASTRPTDVSLTSLAYQAGPLGHFYQVPGSALLHTGSRSAGAAGLYQFTSLTANTKEGANTVNIGPAYVALAQGIPADSNNDGIPDFIADSNGNGIEDANEVPWTNPNNGPLVILSPLPNTTVSGILQLQVNPGTTPLSVAHLSVSVDGGVAVPSTLGVDNPAGSLDQVEFDTSDLTNGPHTLTLLAYSDDIPGQLPTELAVFSQPVSIIVAYDIQNDNWDDLAQLLVNVNQEVPASLPNFRINFFNSGYPKSYNPFAAAVYGYQGVAVNGIIAYSASPAALGYGTGDTDPDIYTFTELSATTADWTSATKKVNHHTSNDASFPDAGSWTVAYEDAAADFCFPSGGSQPAPLHDGTDLAGDYWLHDDQLGNWLKLALGTGGPPQVVLPGEGNAQTWPMRTVTAIGADPNVAWKNFNRDHSLLWSFVPHSWSRNFYGYGHGNSISLLGIPSGLNIFASVPRYRFVFLDGCQTDSGTLYHAFRATKEEINSKTPLDISYYNNTGKRPGAFLGWSVKVPAGEPTFDQNQNILYWTYPALCNFEAQFEFDWTLGGAVSVDDAIDYGLLWAFSPGCDPAVDPDLKAEDAVGNQVVFDPGSQLRIHGFADLNSNSYNQKTDW